MTKLDEALQSAGTNRFREESCYAKENAQRNLTGKTYYVDKGTLRFHKSRVISTHISADGLLFAIVETSAGDWQNKTRVCRSVVFDVFGNVIERKEWPTPRAAGAHLGKFLSTFPTYQHTLSTLRDKVNRKLKDATRILECLNSMEKEKYDLSR